MQPKTYDNRKKIPKKYTWDLDTIYSSFDEYYKDMKKSGKILEKIKKYEGKILASGENLYNVLKLELELDLIFDKMGNYIHLNSELDTRDGAYTVKLAELMDFYARVNTNTNFISEELKKLDEKKLNKYLKEYPKLKDYEFSLRDIIKNNMHLLSLECENLLSNISPILNAGEDIFSKLDDADSDYGFVLDKNGKEHKLTNGTFQRFITGSDRVLRKNADEKLHEYYKNRANTFAACLSNHIKTQSIIANLRKYNSSLEASLSENDISQKFYDNFIEQVNANLPTLHKMMSIYKKAFKLDEMHIYDIRCKFDEGIQSYYSPEEMQRILLEALKPLGKEYIEGVKKAFKERWVDYFETPGKRSGAFSTTTRTVKPYLLLNCTGSFDDLETFVHELGHSMHTYFANKYRSPIDSSYPIFLAEIASTTNELLLNNYLLNNTDDVKVKKTILNNLISMYRGTIFRQIEFAEFERIIYEKTDAKVNLSCEDFTSIYYDLQKKYYGPNVIQDDYIRYECFRIPHLYYNFYVYKYATSLAIAYHFAYKIINNEDGAVENYLNLLKSGGKDYPLNILKKCGIDFEKDDILAYSIKMINDYMNEFDNLLDVKEKK